MTVVDEFTRRALWIEYARHLTSFDVVRVLDQLVELHGRPTTIKTRPTDTFFIEPGSPWQNGHNESFNGVLSDGCLNRWAFLSVREARPIVESWCQEYNEERPHWALNQITPAAYAVVVEQENREAA